MTRKKQKSDAKHSTFKVQLSTFNVRQHGFTLLEVILAVTIAGALLAAAAALMVSVTSVWMERQDRHFFEDHVDGVAEFLQASFSNAGTEIALGDASTEAGNSGEGNESGGSDGQPDTPEPGEVTVGISRPDNNGQSASGDGENSGGAGLVRVSEEPVGWSKPPGYADYQDPLLHFTLKDTPPLFIQSGDAPIVGVEIFLHFEEGEGLSLLWYTPLQEDSEDINDLRRTPISDLITRLEYIYWDEDFEKWETETEPKEGEGEEQYILPRFLKLTFEYQGEIKVRTLTIPVPSQSALIF
jgi:prepilin-type N-terminal cleavage/methylation domain-containing protein